ncbi:hypothetical protein EVAR_55818_1 [Eumeta japonica]|uniref:Uncharacterized protein n=1 Tax=Eumeta variegata TaxID=151549 RepID=A0A4C1ZE59_EUMVA|nr:hypothetical protein EVAR_55818_1 [Eumeta japonica]
MSPVTECRHAPATSDSSVSAQNRRSRPALGMWSGELPLLRARTSGRGPFKALPAAVCVNPLRSHMPRGRRAAVHRVTCERPVVVHDISKIRFIVETKFRREWRAAAAGDLSSGRAALARTCRPRPHAIFYST